MIIWVAGMSCVGKSTIFRKIIDNYDKGELIRPTKYFDCIKFDNFLIIGGRYYRKTTNPGSDYIFAGKDRFKEFIKQEYPKHKNMIIEGQKFLRKEILDWLIENYKIKIYYLSVDRNLLDKRSEERNSWWDKERTDKRTLNEINRMNKILSNKRFENIIEKRTNETENDSENIKKEIMELLEC